MALNWTPEAILNIINGFLAFFFTSITILSPRTRKIKPVHLIDLSIISLASMMILEAISIIYLNIYAKVTSSILIFIGLIFMVLAINFVMKEKLITPSLLFILSMGILYVYLAIQLDEYRIVSKGGYISITRFGLLPILGISLQGLILSYFLYWGIKTYKNSPQTIKLEAIIFLIGTMLISFVAFFFYLISFMGSLFIFLSNSSLLLGIIFILYAIINEPQILYILPYKIHQILVKDKDGNPLFEYNWSRFEIESIILAGFLNTIKIMSKKVLNIGNPIEIKLKNDILIIQDFNLINVVLVSSKSSKLIRNTLNLFTIAFEKKFENNLKNGIKDKKEYQQAIALINEYFSSFPHSFLCSKKDQLSLASVVPVELEQQMNDVFRYPYELKEIKNEYALSPPNLLKEFLTLYEELSPELLENPANEIEIF
ncbi:MAG: hypothetical protein ACFFAS_06690 [Promethearchaeota archaeon]